MPIWYTQHSLHIWNGGRSGGSSKHGGSKDSILSRNVLGAPDVGNVCCLCGLGCRRGRCQREASMSMVVFFGWRGVVGGGGREGGRNGSWLKNSLDFWVNVEKTKIKGYRHHWVYFVFVPLPVLWYCTAPTRTPSTRWTQLLYTYVCVHSHTHMTFFILCTHV